MKKSQKSYSYFDEPLKLKRKVRNTRDTGKAYLSEVLGIREKIYLTRSAFSRGKGQERLLLESEKKIKNITSLNFRQYYRGLPVWDAGITLNVTDKLEILQASVSYSEEVKKSKVNESALKKLKKKIDPGFVEKAIDLKRNAARLKKIGLKTSGIEVKINKVSECIYQYDKDDRLHSHHSEGEGKNLFGELPDIRLPKVDKSVKQGEFYAVLEVMFTTRLPIGNIHWRMMVEGATGDVLYLRILADNLNGYVYDNDPVSTTGDTTITPGSALAILNAARTPRPLPGITLSIPQNLRGQYIDLTELLGPVIPPPVRPPGVDFNFDANTDDFSAVNAYFHNDDAFRLVEEMGFDMAVYFDGTIASPGFPVPVDHRGFLGLVNACAPGNVAGDGSGGFHYGLVQAGQPVGIANCKRVVLHEFGHAILWDNVHSPNLGFAHSVGDSLAALLSDPRSKAPDRFMTFPWLTLSNPGIDRRHDRDVTAGWAWGGTNDDGGYGSEQILSTSHFRAYQSIGGDYPKLCEKEFASRYLTYLILHAVGVLSPATNPNTPEEWSDILQLCDRTTLNFEGQPGGCVHKVIRWAFEKQGAYQLPGAPSPVTTEGAPPLIDVYINDGRNGEYQFSRDVYHSTEIWNRHAPDGGAANQKPIPGQINYAYATVRNRGYGQGADLVTVRGFRNGDCCCDCRKVEDLLWPNHFVPMHTEVIRHPYIGNDSYVIFGPFKWVPECKCNVILFAAETYGDKANIDIMPKGERVALKHLVPFDNNIGVRKFCDINEC